MDGSSTLGALGVVVLIVFGYKYIRAEAGADLFFSTGILDLVMMGIAVVVIAVTIYSAFKDY